MMILLKFCVFVVITEFCQPSLIFTITLLPQLEPLVICKCLNAKLVIPKKIKNTILQSFMSGRTAQSSPRGIERSCGFRSLIPFLLGKQVDSFLFSKVYALSLSHLFFPHIVFLRPNIERAGRPAAVPETYK